ncbi:MAG: phosphonate metabolism protein/1,5-bisphosphokinase (PRPP-forming) PhnN [Pseudolabrys sp.]
MSAPIGPGRLVLVVGPSGAGKDTVINGARQALDGNAHIVFPRRVVTRPASEAEDNDSVSASAFETAAAAGVFALHWAAHGHRYGIPRTIDEDIRCGRTVVCNVSRTIIGHARTRYASVAVILVTAPSNILAERLAHRGRETRAETESRLQRSNQLAQPDPDDVIQNAGSAREAILQFIEVLKIPPLSA